LLGLPADVPLLLFGSNYANQAHHKGFDLLLQALEHLNNDPRANGMELVVFGQGAPRIPPGLGFHIHFTGHMYDDLSLRALYSAADAMVIPSRQDNLPNTGVEAQVCGIPVIAFHVGGLPDIVKHRHTGYLAKTFDTEDLALGILWAIENRNVPRIKDLIRNAAVDKFSSSTVADKYLSLYKIILAN
jgi:glycosyltransferase involved in cell wall biosynthesis